ncbi:hypothetical protein DITRI_Ditri10aG0015100 [Diplodiscus trichospermus]
MASLSAPPLPLLSVFGIICLLLFVSSYTNNSKKEMHQTALDLKLFLGLLPVVLIFAAQFVTKCERFVIPYASAKTELEYRNWKLSWGVVMLVAALLVVVTYQS